RHARSGATKTESRIERALQTMAVNNRRTRTRFSRGAALCVAGTRAAGNLSCQQSAQFVLLPAERRTRGPLAGRTFGFDVFVAALATSGNRTGVAYDTQSRDRR